MRKKLRESPTNLPASASVVEVVTVSDDDMCDGGAFGPVSFGLSAQ